METVRDTGQSIRQALEACHNGDDNQMCAALIPNSTQTPYQQGLPPDENDQMDFSTGEENSTAIQLSSHLQHRTTGTPPAMATPPVDESRANILDNGGQPSKRLRTAVTNNVVIEESISNPLYQGENSQSSPPVNIPAATLTKKHPSKNNRYNDTDIGPFYVFVESMEKNVGMLHPMAVGKLLFQHNPQIKQDVININSLRKNRIRIEMKSAAAANLLVQLPIMTSKNLEAYIPNFLVHKLGIIRNVDTSLSENEIKEEIQSAYPVISVKRFTRKRSHQESEERVAIPVCLLSFRSQCLPSYVYILGMRCPVEPYISPVIMCKKCLRFGHKIQQCRSSVRCNNCGGPHPMEGCSDITTIRCVNCHGPHYATDITCPAYQQQKQLKYNAAHNDPGLQTISSPRLHSYAHMATATPSHKNEEEFPPITQRPPHQPIPQQENAAQEMRPQSHWPRQENAAASTPNLNPISPPPGKPIQPRVDRPSVTPSTNPQHIYATPPWQQKPYIPAQLPITPMIQNPYPPLYHNTTNHARHEGLVEQLLQLITYFISEALSSPDRSLPTGVIRQLVTNLFATNGGI